MRTDSPTHSLVGSAIAKDCGTSKHRLLLDRGIIDRGIIDRGIIDRGIIDCGPGLTTQTPVSLKTYCA